MTATVERATTDFRDRWEAMRSLRPIALTNVPLRRREPSLGRRTLRAFVRFLITFGVGVGGTLAWQAYGDEAKQMLATAYPGPLGWIAPQAPAAAPVAQSAPPAPSIEQQQLNALSLNLAAVRQSVEQLATQVASGQQQMSDEIARLQASEHDILSKIATPPPRPAPVAARKPAPAPQQPAALAPTLAPQVR